MLAPALGPFLFDTSAEGWLARSHDSMLSEWFRRYLSLHPVHVSSITVMERIRGYAVVARRCPASRQRNVEAARTAYLSHLGHVWPVDAAVGVVAAGLMA